MMDGARLHSLVDAALAGSGVPRRHLGREIARLSALFTTERSRRSADYMRDPALRGAYLAFYVPQYAAKIALLLDRQRRDGLVDLPAAPRVLDVGAGPLTGILGAWLLGGDLGPSVALDLARGALDDGLALLGRVAPSTTGAVVTSVGPVSPRALPAGEFDLVVMAHVLNELGDPRRALDDRVAIVEALLERLAPNGRLLLVEPGTRVHGRSLQLVRDALVGRRIGRVLSPCRSAPSCPLLAGPAHWCHGELDWQRPAAFAALEQDAGLRKDVLKESHLLLSRSGRSPESGWRLVGGRMVDGNGVERRYGCGAAGLVTLRGAPRLPREVGAPLRGELLQRPVEGMVFEDDEVSRSRRPRQPARGPSPRRSGPRRGR
jgi:ribosomal protein RSM22 (predicted rRNA methylase)